MGRKEAKTRAFDSTGLTEEQIVAYSAAMVAMSLSDGSMGSEELVTIFRALDTSELSETSRARIRSLMVRPPSLTDALEELRDAPEELRFGILMQLAEVALADEFVVTHEHEVLDHAAALLDIDASQREAVITFVHEIREIRSRVEDQDSAAEDMLKAAERLAPFGIPLAAMYFSGSLLGVSAAQVLSGLAALGMGLASVPGVGLAFLIGMGTVYSAGRLLDQARDPYTTAHEGRRHHRERLLLENLEEAVEHLIDELHLRWEAQGSAAAHCPEVQGLTERLEALQGALIQQRLTL